ncbi:MAG: alginate export family protein [Candidatus Ratteibacteria bacterium]|nr:alginate export family protein [Candidatus Ratteibacteria bacterium]
MTHKLLTAVCALALVLGLVFSASAAVQNVRVGGDIEVKGIYQRSYDIYNEIEVGPLTIYDNNPVVHDYLMQNVRLYVDAALTDNVEAYVRLIYTQDWGMGVNIDDVELDLAYLTLNEMYGYPFSLTIGIQELLYGEGFLVGDGVRPATIDSLGTAYQYDTRKSFDAIKAVWDYEPHQLDLFIAKIAEGSAVSPVGAAPTDTDRDLYGINWNYDGGVYGLWDLALFYDRVNTLFSEDETQTWALSLRGEGTMPQIDVGTLALKGEIVREWGTVEPALQPVSATTGENEILSAWGGYVEGEYTFDNVYAPYLGLGYIYMSGDNDDSDPIEQFNPLYEDETYGEIAEVVYGLYYLMGDTTMTNASIWKISAGVNPTENTSLDLTYYSLYAPQPIFSITGDLDDQNQYIGSEYDLAFTYNYSEDVTFGLMYGIFLPGKLFKNGTDDLAAWDISLDNAQEITGSVKVTF